jgi:uncharacterized glyoxalase superfamily protein PhnB
MHTELQIGDSRFFLNDESPQMGALSPQALNGSPVTLHLFVEDADAVYTQALKAGAQVAMPIADMFWGDRYGVVKDPYGHQWAIASRMKNLTPEEMMEAAAAFFSQANGHAAPT